MLGDITKHCKIFGLSQCEISFMKRGHINQCHACQSHIRVQSSIQPITFEDLNGTLTHDMASQALGYVLPSIVIEGIHVGTTRAVASFS